MAEKLYGLNKTTLIDYPGKVAATVFTRGCNLRCPYCHNPDLVIPGKAEDLLVFSDIMDYLRKRASLLGGVCITGGEPLLHDDLGDIISEIHSLGLPVKLDTNGTLPEKLRKINVDYIAMDLKTSLKRYPELGFKGSESELAGRITESVRYIRESGIPHHFRTTVVADIVSLGEIKELLTLLEGEKQYVLQGFRPGNTLNPAYSDMLPTESSLLDAISKMFESAGISCTVRYNN